MIPRLAASLTGLALAATLPATAFAEADNWPWRPVHIVVAYPPGGSTDVAGRLLAEALSRRIGQAVIVDYRAGAGGTIGPFGAVLASPELKKAMADRGIVAVGSKPEELGQFIRAEIGKWKVPADKIGIVAE